MERTGCGNLTLIAENDLRKISFHLGKAGGCAGSQLQALSEILNFAHDLYRQVDKRKHHIDFCDEIISKLKGISCPRKILPGGSLSCADAVAIVFAKYKENYND